MRAKRAAHLIELWSSSPSLPSWRPLLLPVSPNQTKSMADHRFEYLKQLGVRFIFKLPTSGLDALAELDVRRSILSSDGWLTASTRPLPLQPVQCRQRIFRANLLSQKCISAPSDDTNSVGCSRRAPKISSYVMNGAVCVTRAGFFHRSK